jgi:HEAT repeat protein
MLLLAACSRLASGQNALILWLGTVFQGCGCLLGVFSWEGMRRPLNSGIIMLYVIALSWLLLGSAGMDHWMIPLSEAVLLVFPLLFFAVQNLRDSGALELRRAKGLARQLANRAEWPANLTDCKVLPEVEALREALHIDAEPAITLLTNPKPQVRVAALAALEFRHEWRKNQPEIILHFAKNAPEPELRAAAILALANTEQRHLVEALAEYTHDPSPLVRAAASQALLWKPENCWPWISQAFRAALASPELENDGPLCEDGHLFPPEAVADLTAWCSEKGVLAIRAAQTLGEHYKHTLTQKHDPALVLQLRQLVIDVHAPSMLRMEIARVLQQFQELDDVVLESLMKPITPASLRLIAVETLLARGESVQAAAALHDLARLPNRELALATADVVQRRLGVDLGLQRGQPLPPVHSRKAADVARSLMIWALGQEAPTEAAAARAAGLPHINDDEW